MNICIRWFGSVLTALDVLASALTFGDYYQTISARLGKARAQGRSVGAFFANILDAAVKAVFGQAGHCDLAFRHFEIITANIQQEK